MWYHLCCPTPTTRSAEPQARRLLSASIQIEYLEGSFFRFPYISSED